VISWEPAPALVEPPHAGDLDCPYGLTLLSYGLRIGVHADEAETLERLRQRLPPGRAAASSRPVDRSYALTRDSDRGLSALDVDGQRLAEGYDLERIGDLFEADLQLYVAEMAPHHVFVHAGAVGWRGEAIIVPGRSQSGKTTLVAELVRAGATYYSDEYAVLDAGGRVHPYPEALSIRRAYPERPLRYPVEALGGRRGTNPLPVGLVLITEYEPGAVWEPRFLSAGRGALALLANTVSARRQPVAALAALREVVVHSTVLEGVRGDARATVGSILDAL
jgi:hypothetical protein